MKVSEMKKVGKRSRRGIKKFGDEESHPEKGIACVSVCVTVISNDILTECSLQTQRRRERGEGGGGEPPGLHFPWAFIPVSAQMADGGDTHPPLMKPCSERHNHTHTHTHVHKHVYAK